MPIDRDRVRQLKRGKDPAEAEYLRRSGEKPWLEPAGALLKLWTAPTLEEFNRLAREFPRHLRRLRSIVRARRQPPARARREGWFLRDRDLEWNLNVLVAAAIRTNHPDRFSDPGGWPARVAMGLRLEGLSSWVRFKPEKHLDPSPPPDVS
jgi:hypothetical protein